MPLQAKEDHILLAEARLRQVDHRLLRVDHRRQAALHRADLILRGLRAKVRPFLVSRVRRQASPTRRHRHRVLAARSILQAHRLQNRVLLQRRRSILPAILRLLVRPRVHREQMARGIHRVRRHQHHRQLLVSMQPEARRHQPARLLPASLLTAIVASLVAVDSVMQ
jgi:hypothetical protein